MSPVYKLSNAGGFTSKQRYTSMLAGNTAYTPPSWYESIATATLGSGGSFSIGFTNIPQDYTHLQIRGILRSDRSGSAAEGLNLRINDNSSSGSYTYHRVYGDGSTVTADGEGGGGGMPIGQIPGASATASIFGATIIDILDYTSTNKYKTVRHLTGTDRNGAGLMVFGSGLYYANTNAITGLFLYGSSAQNLSQYSTIALYGIKSA